MTMEMMKEQLNALCKDITFWEWDDENKLDVTVEDFEGFDEDWDEVYADIDDDAVEVMIEWLESHCDSHEGDFYYYYTFGDLVVGLGWASYDI